MTSKRKVQANKFRYLGKILTDNWRCAEKIKAEIVMVKEPFNKTKRPFCNNLNLEMRKGFIKWLLHAYKIWNTGRQR